MVRLEPRGLVGRQRECRGMCFAETEGAEGLQHRPCLFGDLQAVPVGEHPGYEPGPDLRFTGGVAESTSNLIGLGQRAPGQDRHQTEHLLVEDHDPTGLGQGLDEIGVGIGRFGPAMSSFEEGTDHVAFHRPRPEQRDINDQVLERLGGELPDQLTLTRGLDLKAPQRSSGLDERKRGGVIASHAVDVHGHPVDAAHLLHRIRHCRLHPDAQQIQLEETEIFYVVLVELAHREAEEAGLDRRAVQQRAIGQQDATRVQGDMAGQPVQPLHEPEQEI